jgi:uncharacterized protein (TIGR03435 family)
MKMLSLALLLSSGTIMAQSPPTPIPSAALNANATPIHFEVAAIRRNKDGIGGGHGTTPDGYDQKNMPLVFFIGMAYHVFEFQRIQGLPTWCKTDSYDISAKVSDADRAEWSAAEGAKFPDALQALLADRFQLKAHFETRDSPAYALVVVKNGPKFKAATPGETYALHPISNKSATVAGGPSQPGSGRGQLAAQSASMAQFAQYLSSMENHILGRQVIDQTGLTGHYDFTIPTFSAGSNDPENTEASIFTALQESLGLKLEPAKLPVQFLVIDHIERPSEN